MKNPLKKINTKFKTAIRERAIKRARTRIILAKREVVDFSEEQLEVIVQEEESKIYAEMKEKGFYAVLAVLGVSLFG